MIVLPILETVGGRDTPVIEHGHARRQEGTVIAVRDGQDAQRAQQQRHGMEQNPTVAVGLVKHGCYFLAPIQYKVVSDRRNIAPLAMAGLDWNISLSDSGFWATMVGLSPSFRTCVRPFSLVM